MLCLVLEPNDFFRHRTFLQVPTTLHRVLSTSAASSDFIVAVFSLHYTAPHTRTHAHTPMHTCSPMNVFTYVYNSTWIKTLSSLCIGQERCDCTYLRYIHAGSYMRIHFANTHTHSHDRLYMHYTWPVYIPIHINNINIHTYMCVCVCVCIHVNHVSIPSAIVD